MNAAAYLKGFRDYDSPAAPKKGWSRAKLEAYYDGRYDARIAAGTGSYVTKLLKLLSK